MVILDIARENSFVMRGRAPDFKCEREIYADISGENLKIAVNSNFHGSARSSQGCR